MKLLDATFKLPGMETAKLALAMDVYKKAELEALASLGAPTGPVQSAPEREQGTRALERHRPRVVKG